MKPETLLFNIHQKFNIPLEELDTYWKQAGILAKTQFEQACYWMYLTHIFKSLICLHYKVNLPSSPNLATSQPVKIYE